MEGQIESFIFDFFGVVCSEIAPFWLRERFSDEEAARIKSTVVGAADRGDISQAQLFSELATLSGETPSRIEADWLSYAEINWSVVERIRMLAADHKIGLLTNSPAPLVRYLIEQNALAELFRAVVVSSEHRCAKPDPEIYLLALRTLGSQPSDTILIDDNPANVQGAIEVGMSGFLFESIEGLDAVLRL
jgi:putative hydrolase of the HAD superfamily